MPLTDPFNKKMGERVRSLERGLTLLKAMNAHPQASITELARSVGIPRSTAYRMLDTLVAMGFVTLSRSTDRYRLTREVQSLSQGFIDEAWIEQAWLEILALTKKVIWPVDLLTLEGTAMVIRRSTHTRSSMSIDYGMVGRRWPLTESSAGRAYLAFCPPEERKLVVDSFSLTDHEESNLVWLLEQTKKQGLGIRIGGIMAKTSSISAPVCVENSVLCCITLIWITSALSIERALDELAPALKSTASQIAHSAQDLRAP